MDKCPICEYGKGNICKSCLTKFDVMTKRNKKGD